MKIGSVRPSPSDSCSRRTGVLDCRSTRTARSRTSTMDQTYSRQGGNAFGGGAVTGPSGQLREAGPARSAVEQVLQRRPEERATGLLAEAGDFLRGLDGPRPGVGIALAHERHHQLLDEPRLTGGGVFLWRQVAGL